MLRLFTAVFGLAALAAAQNVITRDTVPAIVAQGQARVSVAPDQVRIDIGVVTQAATAEAAAAQNAKQTSEVLAALKKSLGPAADVRTAGYSLQPNYRHSRDGAPPVIVGYIASNTVQVTSSEPANIGKVIDSATKTGANNIQGIQFLLKYEQAVRGEALKQACLNAQANAQAIASGLGMKLGRVLRVTDAETPPVMPMRREMVMAQAAAADTPIEAGRIEVSASVVATIELLP